MGSICCVPTKPHDPPSNRDRWSNGLNEPRWHINGNFSPPLSHCWDDKSLPEDLSGMQFYRSSFSSSSRGSRIGSSRFLSHHRAHSNGLFSQGPSPSNSFRASLNPLSASQTCHMGDISLGTSDSNSSPCISLSKEGYATTTPTTYDIPEASPLFSSSAEDCFRTMPPADGYQLGQQTFFPKSFSSISSYSSSKTTPESRLHPVSGMASTHSPASEGRHSLRSASSGGDSCIGSVGASSDWWSMQTFSELVASSRRERLHWISANSPSDFISVQESMGAEYSELLALERIRANFCQGCSSPMQEQYTCGLCSRGLSQHSPLSSQKMMGTMDPPSVGVLQCGHAFHANCLEQATMETERHDPPCPLCNKAIRMSKCTDGAESLSFSKALFRSYSSHGQTSSRNKLSRIGILADDTAGAEGAPTALHAGTKLFSMHDSMRKKCKSQMPSTHTGKSLSKRAFSFRGRQNRDAIANEARVKRIISPSQISPDNNHIEYLPALTHARKGCPASFRYLRGW